MYVIRWSHLVKYSHMNTMYQMYTQKQRESINHNSWTVPMSGRNIFLGTNKAVAARDGECRKEGVWCDRRVEDHDKRQL